MPLTFLSHQAVVLPLKLRAPYAFSGTALVLGSMAPDMEYFLRTYPGTSVSHTWTGQLTFCLPITLALFWIVTRIIALPLALHLPDGGDLRLSEYALLREQPAGLRHWARVATSAVIGSVSHVVLDRVSGGWSGGAGARFDIWLPTTALGSDAARVAFKLSTWLVLAVISLLLMKHIGRRSLLRRWLIVRDEAQAERVPSPGAALPHASASTRDRSPPFRRRDRHMFWSLTGIAGLVGGALGIVYRRPGFFLDEPATWVHIGLCATSGAFLGLLLACIAWNRGARTVTSPRGVN